MYQGSAHRSPGQGAWVLFLREWGETKVSADKWQGASNEQLNIHEKEGERLEVVH